MFRSANESLIIKVDHSLIHQLTVGNKKSRTDQIRQPPVCYTCHGSVTAPCPTCIQVLWRKPRRDLPYQPQCEEWSDLHPLPVSRLEQVDQCSTCLKTNMRSNSIEWHESFSGQYEFRNKHGWEVGVGPMLKNQMENRGWIFKSVSFRPSRWVKGELQNPFINSMWSYCEWVKLEHFGGRWRENCILLHSLIRYMSNKQSTNVRNQELTAENTDFLYNFVWSTLLVFPGELWQHLDLQQNLPCSNQNFYFCPVDGLACCHGKWW